MSVDKDKIVTVLEQLIKYRSNDLLMDIESGYANESTERGITNLIIGITRYLHDIRYCSRKDCPCSPEKDIEHHYLGVKDILQQTKYALHPIPWWTIEQIIKGDSP